MCGRGGGGGRRDERKVLSSFREMDEGKVLSSFREMERSCITLWDLGSTVKIILGSTRKYHNGAREIWALLSGIKGALTPTSPLQPPRDGLI